jgi:hypothetical protein
MPSRGEDGTQDLEGPEAYPRWRPSRDPTTHLLCWYTRYNEADQEWQQHTYRKAKQVFRTLPKREAVSEAVTGLGQAEAIPLCTLSAYASSIALAAAIVSSTGARTTTASTTTTTTAAAAAAVIFAVLARLCFILHKGYELVAGHKYCRVNAVR